MVGGGGPWRRRSTAEVAKNPQMRAKSCGWSARDHHLDAFAGAIGRARTTGSLAVGAVVERVACQAISSASCAEVRRCRAIARAAVRPRPQASGLRLIPAFGDAGPSGRRIVRNAARWRGTSSSTCPFQVFQTFGLVPRMSATVSR